MLRTCPVLLSLLAFAHGFSDEIAFCATRGKSWQLFITDELGKNTRQLTRDPFDIRSPDWSPDKRSIAYTNSEGKVFIIDAADGAKRDSLIDPMTYFTQAVFQDSAHKVLLVAGKKGEIDQTFLAGWDRSSRKVSPVFRMATPLFHLAYHRGSGDLLFANTQCGSPCGHIIQEIWLRERGARRMKQMHLLDGLSRNPSWEPSGKAFFFESEAQGRYVLFRQERDSKHPRPFFASQDPADNRTSPKVSADGGKLLFLDDGKKPAMLRFCYLSRPERIQTIDPFPGDENRPMIKDPTW